MKRDSFAGRYVIKLGSSIAIALCNIVIQFLLPRAISVEEYGFYSYNLNVFTSVVVIANLSMSSALVAKYSKRVEDIGYVYFYLKFFGIVTLILSIGILALYSFDVMRDSFGGQAVVTVFLGLEASVLMKFMADVISLYDSAAISRFPSVLQIVQRLCLCIFVVVSYLIGRTTLIAFYIGQIAIFIVVILCLLVVFFIDHKVIYNVPINRPKKEYFKEYYEFCRPLVIAGAISQGIVILMNYTLMKYSGAIEQAMFGAAWQLNTLVGYVFSPYAELMKREFAVITDQTESMKHRLWQSLRTIIWLVSYFAVFIGVFASWLVPLIYGSNYADAALVTQMIMIYTIFQAWGQMCGSYMIAVEATKGYAVLSVVGQLVSVICVVLFQVPNDIFPNGLGSMGIGLTYMVANYISVIAMMFYILRLVKRSHLKMHGIYMIAIGFCLLVSFAIRTALEPIFNDGTMLKGVIGVGISGIIYTVIIGGLIYAFPGLLGIHRETIIKEVGKVWLKVKRK